MKMYGIAGDTYKLWGAVTRGSRCPVSYTLVAADPDWDDAFLRMFGGRQLESAIPHVYGWQVTIEGVTKHVPGHWVLETVAHTFPNNGGRTSWCSGCGCVGHWNWRRADYEAE